MAQSKISVLSALAPFGRIGHKLGWRWIFPVGTFPVPFHRGLFFAIPLAALAWLIWIAIDGSSFAWKQPLILAAILAIPLSIPFLQWVLLAFRLHTLQAVLVPAAMALLMLAIWRGVEPLYMAAVPALFFIVHLTLAIAGRTVIGRLVHDNANLAELSTLKAAPRPVLLTGDSAGSHTALQLIDNDGLDQVYYALKSGETIGVYRFPPEALADLAPRISRAGIKHLAITAPKSGDYQRLAMPVDALPDDIVQLETRPGSRWRKLLLGPVTTVSAAIRDGTHLHFHSGMVAPVSWFPGFMFLIYLQLGATAAFKPHVGFVRSRTQAIGKPHDNSAQRSTLLAAIFQQGPKGTSFGAAQVKARVAVLLDGALAAELRSLELLLDAPAEWVKHQRPFKMLLGEAELYAGRAEQLCDAFARARAAKAVAALTTIGQLLGALPDAQFHSIGAQLLDLLNSAEVAGVKRTSFTVTPETIKAIRDGIPQDPLPLGGYGLMRAAPELYIRLGDLGEPARALIMGLGKRFNWPKVLLDARERLVSGR